METNETTTEQPTLRSVGVRYGVIAALVGIIMFVIFTTAAIDFTQGPWRWFNWLITAVLVFLAHKYYKDNATGFMSYGEGIKISLWMGLVSGVISSIFTYIYVKFIDQSFLDMIRDTQIRAMEERGMSEEQIEQGMKFASMFMSPEAMLIFGLIGGVVGTVIIALIVTIFTQKKAPETAF